MKLRRVSTDPFSASGTDCGAVPAIVARDGTDATRRFLEFFAVTIRNRNTRQAYLCACRRFLTECGQQGLESLAAIEPLHVATYIEALARTFEKPTVNQHLAAIRMLFGWLMAGNVVSVNPAISVRGLRHVVKRGKTPALSADQVRQLLHGIDPVTTVGLRDRALIGIMLYSVARVGAVVAMREEDFYCQGDEWRVRLREKGGKVHDLPCHHILVEYLESYIRAAGSIGRRAPLFRSTHGRTGELTRRPMSRTDVWRMLGRRAQHAGLNTAFSCHSFRATGITRYLSGGGTIEKAQRMAGHASERTTRLYDRRDDTVTLEEIERIVI